MNKIEVKYAFWNRRKQIILFINDKGLFVRYPLDDDYVKLENILLLFGKKYYSENYSLELNNKILDIIIDGEDIENKINLLILES